MDHSYLGAIKSPTCMIPFICLICPKIPSDQWHFIYPQTLIAFDLIEPFTINAWHAGYKELIHHLFLYTFVSSVLGGCEHDMPCWKLMGSVRRTDNLVRKILFG